MRTLLFTIIGTILSMQLAHAEVQWRSKPVQCGSMESLMEKINEAGEEPLVAGMTRVTIEDEMYDLPLVFFINTESKEFTVVEFHMQDKEACVIGWGGAITFEIHEWFDKNFPKLGKKT